MRFVPRIADMWYSLDHGLSSATPKHMIRRKFGKKGTAKGGKIFAKEENSILDAVRSEKR